MLNKIDKGGSRTWVHWAHALLFYNKLGVVFVNFDCITRIYFNYNQHTMFTICLLFSKLTTKRKGICEKETFPRPQKFYRDGTAPPGFLIPGPAPDRYINTLILLLTRRGLYLYWSSSVPIDELRRRLQYPQVDKNGYVSDPLSTLGISVTIEQTKKLLESAFNQSQT